MVADYEITTMAELSAAATDENLEVLVADLKVWLRHHILFRGTAIDVGHIFKWRDDGIPGVREVRVTVEDSDGHR